MSDQVDRVSVGISAAVRAQVAEALADGSSLGRLISQRIDAQGAHLIVPAGLSVPVAAVLNELTRGGLAQQTPTRCLTQWLANRIAEYLQSAPDACCVVENRYARAGDPSLSRFKQAAMTLRGGGVVHLLVDPVSTDAVLDTLKKASSLPHAAVFWTRRPASAAGPLDAAELAAPCERVFLFVCDGEAYLELETSRSDLTATS